MEPNCAICDGPAYLQCPCEHQSLILAVEQAEQRVLHPMWDEIRYWVTTQAKAEIHRGFQARSSFRRAQHSKYLYHNSGRFTNEMLDRVNSELRRGVDEDWRAAVQRYPEVLDYFYSMVGWTVRAEPPPPDMQSPRNEDLPAMHPGDRSMPGSLGSSGGFPHGIYGGSSPPGPGSMYSGPNTPYTASSSSSYHGGGGPHLNGPPFPLPQYPPHPGFTYLRAPPYHRQ